MSVLAPQDNYPLVTNARFVDAFGLTRAMLVSHAIALMDAKTNIVTRGDLLVAVLRFAPENKFDQMLATCTQEGIFSCVAKTDDIHIKVNEQELAARLETLTKYAQDRAETGQKQPGAINAPARPRTYINARPELVSNRLVQSLTREREREYVYLVSKTNTNNSLPPSSSSLVSGMDKQGISLNPAREGVGTSGVTGPLTSEEVERFAATYGIIEVESACLKAQANAQIVPADAKYASRFRGYVDACLKRDWPAGNKDASAQNAQRKRQVAAASPSAGQPAPRSAPSRFPTQDELRENLLHIRAIKEKLGIPLCSPDNTPPKAKKTDPNSGIVNSGLSRLQRDAMQAELDAQSKRGVEAFMSAPDTREK